MEERVTDFRSERWIPSPGEHALLAHEEAPV